MSATAENFPSPDQNAALDAMVLRDGSWSARRSAIDPRLEQTLPRRLSGSAALYFARHTTRLAVDGTQIAAIPKISSRVRKLLLTWLGLVRGDKAASHAAFVAVARDPAAFARVVWQAADRIWDLALPGTPDTGFPFYSKRTILSGVLGSALLYQFGGRTPEEVARFVDRRLANVALIGRLRRIGKRR